MTDKVMPKKKVKKTTIVHKTQHKKLKLEQHEPHSKLTIHPVQSGIYLSVCSLARHDHLTMGIADTKPVGDTSVWPGETQ